ncbi:carbamoyltransferase HypF [Microbulbifer pacificus]|uniref:Carbamoyltransferase HypF n=1 Tax=Microbulbifer pacificus TaxID=407164 RepID=A0AAU0MZU0_9GAMM|nr:carbamoyltransferase HypF [Microbulbifer pacificus]WOX05628.1 carbamoyltransferase HypF [Microbulbifer pacificus]
MNAEAQERLRLDIRGVVQGVGFRPFIYKLAMACRLNGWTANNGTGVRVEIEGSRADLRRFLETLPLEKPALAEIEYLSSTPIPLQQARGFHICTSETGTEVAAVLPPDLAPCEDCLQEISDPENRRFRYPFTNCTRCGPRFSIVERLPYDRARTAMKHFPLCAACEREYRDPGNRRFHAEPIACPDCGPALTLLDQFGNALAERDDALRQAVSAIRAGKIVALKGVGGFQLLVDAANTTAVKRLRDRKCRPHKPFALMYPDIQSLQADCVTSTEEEALLCAQQRPILLLKAKAQSQAVISPEVAPANPNLGAMLPSSPLHYLLLQSLQRPLIATSGNLSGEPICIDNAEAVQRLGKIADLFLLHDRAILRPLDDSVVRVMGGQPVLFRRARGYAPLPLPLPDTLSCDEPLLALGADLKNCVAACCGNTAYLGPYVGDLQDRSAQRQFERAIADIAHLHGLTPANLLCDRHRGYISNRWARQQWSEHGGEKTAGALEIQHHVAHFFSCMAEHQYRGSAVGISWDGTGFGEDGSVRGSECLYWNGRDAVKRIASLRDFPLPGGESAIHDPRRILAGMLYECLGERAFSCVLLQNKFDTTELSIVRTMLKRGINTPRCSSMGRLFDAVAVILGLVDSVSFEGQAAMAVEFAAEPSASEICYPFSIEDTSQASCTLDWAPMVLALLDQEDCGLSVADRACAFHNTLAQMVQAAVHRAGERHVFLSGGVFQNKRLLENTAGLLRHNGFHVHCHSKVPPNDGGIALGQLYYARCMADCRVASDEGSAICV